MSVETKLSPEWIAKLPDAVRYDSNNLERSPEELMNDSYVQGLLILEEHLSKAEAKRATEREQQEHRTQTKKRLTATMTTDDPSNRVLIDISELKEPSDGKARLRVKAGDFIDVTLEGVPSYVLGCFDAMWTEVLKNRHVIFAGVPDSDFEALIAALREIDPEVEIREIPDSGKTK